MQLGRVALGRIGANIVPRLIKDGRRCVVFDQLSTVWKDLAKAMAVGATLADLVKNWIKSARPGCFSEMIARSRGGS